jgi:hypothetical protein
VLGVAAVGSCERPDATPHPRSVDAFADRGDSASHLAPRNHSGLKGRAQGSPADHRIDPTDANRLDLNKNLIGYRFGYRSIDNDHPTRVAELLD